MAIALILKIEFDPSIDIVYLNRWTIYVTTKEKFNKLRQRILREFEKSRRDYFIIEGDSMIIIPAYRIVLATDLKNLRMGEA